MQRKSHAGSGPSPAVTYLIFANMACSIASQVSFISQISQYISCFLQNIIIVQLRIRSTIHLFPTYAFLIFQLIFKDFRSHLVCQKIWLNDWYIHDPYLSLMKQLAFVVFLFLTTVIIVLVATFLTIANCCKNCCSHSIISLCLIARVWDTDYFCHLCLLMQRGIDSFLLWYQDSLSVHNSEKAHVCPCFLHPLSHCFYQLFISSQ